MVKCPICAVVKDEKTYLELCEKSFMLCYEGRFRVGPHVERATYIT